MEHSGTQLSSKVQDFCNQSPSIYSKLVNYGTGGNSVSEGLQESSSVAQSLKTYTLNPKPYTLNPIRHTLNTEPYKPYSANHISQRRGRERDLVAKLPATIRSGLGTSLQRVRPL